MSNFSKNIHFPVQIFESDIASFLENLEKHVLKQLTEIFLFSNLASMASRKSAALKNAEDKVVGEEKEEGEEEEEEEEEEKEEVSVSPTEVKMSQIVLPCHCNHQQELCVGQLLKWIDIAACLSGNVAFAAKWFPNRPACDERAF